MTDNVVTDAVVAFIAAQSAIGNVAKNAENTFFKTAKGKNSGYVDLAALNSAVIPALAENDLALLQRMETIEGKSFVVTQVVHANGYAFSPSFYPVITKDANDPQKFGAGVTYARRYALMLYMGIAAEDDDGNLAATPPPDPRVAAQKALQANLKASGLTTKEAVAEAFATRWPNVASPKDLTLAQIEEWSNELTLEKTPF